MLPSEHILAFLQQHIGHTADIKFQELHMSTATVQLVYLTSVCDEAKLRKTIITPFYELGSPSSFHEYMISTEGYQAYEDEEKTIQALLHGFVFLLVNEEFFLIQCANSLTASPLDTGTESTIQGPQKSLSEDVKANISLIRHRYRQASLTVETPPAIGKINRVDIAFLYDKDRAKEEHIQQIRQQLAQIKAEIVQSAGQLQREFTKQRYTLFPVFMITERPDRIAYNLAKGKVVILLNGTPFAMIAPAVFFDFMSSMEDLYQTYWVAKFLVILRYIGLFLSIILPAAYVSATSFNPEIFRVQLALSIAGSRFIVPFPSFLEVFFMLLMMELLVEASIRLPKTIGSTATTVGGLILGQAAVEAGLVSNIMIIVVGAVAISNFVIPISEMSFSMRVVKYILLLLTTITGTIGLIVGVMLLLVYLANLTSLGEPYLRVTYKEKSRQVQPM